MNKKIVFAAVSGVLLILLIGILLPPPESDRSQFLPWQVEVLPDGKSRVFGITLGETTLDETERRLNSSAEITLFATAEGAYRVEAYFDKVVLGGFSAKMVMVMQLTQEEGEAIFLRGARISTLGSGTNKVTIGSADARRVYATPIASLAYLTRASLDDELLLKRFGEPAERIAEAASGTVHWLYPALGLDVALSPQGKGVFQYVLPADFEALADPLRHLGEEGAGSGG